MNTNEQQWQECPLEESTHARTATGEVYALYWSSALIGASDPRNRRIYIGDSTAVLARNFPTLGITPVRKKEVNPVEFVGEAWGVSFDGNCTEITIRVGDNVGGQCGKDLIGRNLKVEVQP